MTARDDRTAIAVIGMAGRFPLAPSLDNFWAACRDGVDCISRWQGARDDTRVLAGGLMLDPDLFDAAAFGISPTEAELLDPQHRVFMELCLEALEHASVIGSIDTLVSVYAAAAPSRYRPDGAATSEVERYERMIANAPDYLATRVSYQLDLRGEAVTVQTACSSSLVAVHLACQSLLSNRTDIALAGGVSIDPDQHLGYVHEPGMITSPDGVCLPFDVNARGAVPGNGGGVVVLQRLSDAVAERRVVHAVIRVSVINNDGRNKASFMAPNVEGQSELIIAALAQSEVPAESIGYLETHGTATRLGDAIEFEAARLAFRQFTDRRTFCALGSLKANFGHLDRAAGVAGLIKVVHAVRDGVIPPLHGFRTPNPDFDMPASPFRVPITAEPWRATSPRRAGVSAFGVGGTNAHSIVEEYCPAPPDNAGAVVTRQPLALALSGHSDEQVVSFAAALADHVNADNARDVAHTLAKGRVARATRSVVVDQPSALADRLRHRVPTLVVPSDPGPLAVLFSGQGAALAYDATKLAGRYELFRQEIEAFTATLGVSADKLLAGVSGADPEYRDFAYQPSLVAVQVALARLAERAGIETSAYCGHSLGEYAAAYVAGVFDAAGLMTVLAARDRVMRAAPDGRMLSVLASEEAVMPHIVEGVDLAGEIWRDRMLLSGPPDCISRQQAVFDARGIVTRVLPGRIAPHGRLMRPVADAFRKAFRGVHLRPAARPVISTLTGRWAEPDRLADPDHWVRHLCEPFRFRQAFETLTASNFRRFAEASPGTAMTTLVRTAAVSCASLGGETTDPAAAFLTALGELWCAGAGVDWNVANGISGGRFTVLPPYPFQRQRYWTHRPATNGPRPQLRGGGLLEHPVWHIRPFIRSSGAIFPPTIVIHGVGAIADELTQRLMAQGVRVTPWTPEARALPPGHTVVDLTHAAERRTHDLTAAWGLREWLDDGLLGWMEPLRQSPATLLTVTRGLWQIAPGERPDLSAAAVIGVARCAPHDWPGLRTRLVDLDPHESVERDVDAILAELSSRVEHDVAYRGAARYERRYEEIAAHGPSPLRRGGTYVVLGGAGRLGAVVAEAISREVAARIVLVGRDDTRPLTAAAVQLLVTAERRGCEIVRRAAHTDERAGLRHVLDELDGEGRRTDGVFHLAANTATSSFEVLAETTMDAAVEIARAKVCTAALLAEEIAGRPYDFVVLFSSISTVIGANRFGVYVAANAYLDALAAAMREQTGRRWQSLIWDGWTADGIATDQALGSDNGAALLLQALRCDAPTVAPVVQPLELRRAAVRDTLALVAADHQRLQSPSASPSIADRVARVICDVTGYKHIEPKQSFASLGIGSLRMMQIAVRLRPLVGAGFGKLLAATSAEALIALVSAKGGAPSDETLSALPAGALSTPQQRLWYLTQLEAGSSSYNVPFGWIVPGATTRSVRDIVLELLARHDMLRAAYTHDEKANPVRVTIAATDVPVGEIRLPDSESDFDRIGRDFVEPPFDLRLGSTRVLIASGRHDTRVVFVCHHLSIDAWSIHLLGTELACLVAGVELPAPRATYHDFVCAEDKLRSGPEFEQLARHWRETLAGAKPTVPPADEGLSESEAPPTAAVTTVLPLDRLQRLRAMLRDEGATLYGAALTSLALALSQWCGVREIVVGTNLANRTTERLESVVGMFVDPVVLRLSVGLDDDATTVGAALAVVRQSLTAAIAHAGIPYLDVVQAVERRGARGTSPLFSVMATMFDHDDERASLAPLDVPLPATSKFPLAIEFLPRAEGLLIHVLYAADRYRPATIERFSQRIVRYLTALANDRQTLLSEVLDTAPGAARKRFARRFNTTER